MRGLSKLLGLFLALLGFAGLSSPAFATLPAEQPYRIADYGRLVTDVFINGQGPFSFLIDTASSRSLIFERVRARLGLAPSQPEHLVVYGINDVAEALPVKPDTFAIAGEALHGLTLGVLPDQASAGPDGVLGVDVLARYFVVLDRGAMRIRLLPPGADSARPFADWPQAQLTAQPLKNLSVRFWYIKTSFNDHNFTSLLDLGASFTLLNWNAAEVLGVHKRDFLAKGLPPDDLQDILGKTSPAVRLDGVNVRLPGKRWDNHLIVVADAPVFRYFNADERPAAIVGLGLLGDSSLAIDFAGGRLFIGPQAKMGG
jgi:predicted aspartyl protease